MSVDDDDDDDHLYSHRKTMNHTVESSSLTKLADEGSLQLHSSDDSVVIWLRDTAMKVLV